MSAKREIKEGDVFYPKGHDYRYSFRRVVGILGDRIFYSIGDRTLNCSRRQFIAATRPNDRPNQEK